MDTSFFLSFRSRAHNVNAISLSRLYRIVRTFNTFCVLRTENERMSTPRGASAREERRTKGREMLDYYFATLIEQVTREKERRAEKGREERKYQTLRTWLEKK